LIDNSAKVHSSAVLADDVEVGPWTVIGANVEIGAGTVIGPHVVIKCDTRIGRNNRIFQFASVGEDCQDKKYAGESTRLEIGDGNIIREHCTIHRGTIQDQRVTQIGNNNLFMVGTHVAHDCVVGNDIVLANGGLLGGHVKVGDHAVIGAGAGVHQYCHLGAHCMIAGHATIWKDVPAYLLVSGSPATSHGLNTEGLRRRGFSAETTKTLKKAYKLVFRNSLPVETALREIASLQNQSPELNVFVESIRNSTRGIVR